METQGVEKRLPAMTAAAEEKRGSVPPAVAVQSDNVDAIRKSVEDAAAVSGGLWLSYLFVLFYIAIAAGAVTHVDLLLENPVKLPFLNVELPLKAFFFLAPLLFLISHAYTLAHLVILADKAKDFDLKLREQIKQQVAEPESEAKKEIADLDQGLRRQLPSNIFVQFIAGPDDIRASWLGVLLKTIAWTTLIIGPVLLLLLLQLQFLPYHSGPVTWTHRLALLVDLLLIWWLWRRILPGRRDFGRWPAWTTPAVGIVSTVAVVIFSWAVAIFPGEWQEDRLGSLSATRGWLFAGEVDEITRRRESLFSSTIVLPGFDLLEALKIDDPNKLESKERSIDLRGRHLEQAVLDGANLRKADLSGAYLERASLFGARLQGARLASAHLQGASMIWTDLQSASLKRAQLQGATLMFASLQGAALHEAELQGASLFGVSLVARHSIARSCRALQSLHPTFGAPHFFTRSFRARGWVTHSLGAPF